MKCGKTDQACMCRGYFSKEGTCGFGGSCEHQVPDKPTERIIGEHWLETALSRVRAGEPEAAVMADYDWVRKPVPSPQPKPAVPEWATRVIGICNRLWPCGTTTYKSDCETVFYHCGIITQMWYDEPERPAATQSQTCMAVSSEYWHEMRSSSPRYVYFNRADNPDERVMEGDEWQCGRTPKTNKWIITKNYGMKISDTMFDFVRRRVKP